MNRKLRFYRKIFSNSVVIAGLLVLGLQTSVAAAAEDEIVRVQQSEQQSASVNEPASAFEPVTEQVSQSELQTASANEIKPFGANLFTGGFSAEKEDGLNPGYLITQGDVIELRVWGAIEQNEQLVVDPKGNIFVQKVGPVRVAGVRNDQLNSVVTHAIRKVYTENVQVYTSLATSQPIAVFVTGYVNNPGRFPGVSSNSVLYFLDRAAGIDLKSGSFRNIKVLRRNKVIASVDLYKFLINGELLTTQLRDGDTILVGSKGNIVTVYGDVRSSAEYELLGDSVTGGKLLELARLGPLSTHAFWTGARDGDREAGYLSMDEFRQTQFRDGDVIEILSDGREDSITVVVEGVFDGPSRYVVNRGARLGKVLDMIPVIEEVSAYESISIRRESIYQQQKQALEESLRRLENAFLLASSSTKEEAAIRLTEAQLISDFTRRVRDVEPNGRLVLGKPSEAANLLLQQGDVITIPERTQTILISGEVLIPQALLFDESYSVQDYIAQSGGFNDQADDENILLIRQNGSAVLANTTTLKPGDQILVLPQVPPKYLQIAKEIVDVIYKVAISAGVLVKIN